MTSDRIYRDALLKDTEENVVFSGQTRLTNKGEIENESFVCRNIFAFFKAKPSST